MKSTSQLQRGRRCCGGAQTGSVLIEALVAILIFSFGVLGLVGLQGAMLRNQTDAKFRTDAAFLANELVGLIETDQANYANYATAPGAACTYAKCADWVRKVTNGLPNGKAAVVFTPATPATNGGAYSVAVSWTMPDGTRHQFLAATSIFK